MKYYLISGEVSGDLHGSKVIKALKKVDSHAQFRAWGGELMKKEGAVLVKHIKDLAFMGFWEVFLHLPSILKNLSRCKKDILAYQPDVIIYIDYPGFNLRIAEWAKKHHFKNHYYISPQVWAWKENRVQKIKHALDALYVILPFEKTFYEKKHNHSVHYVGHPLIESIPNYPKDPGFLKKHKLSTSKPIVALLPGSRSQEIKKMLPLFIEVAQHFPDYQFVVAALNTIPKNTYQSLVKNTSVKLAYEATYALLQHSKAALVTSGTATLETALFNIPQLVCYKTSTLTYWIASMIIKLKYISLVNLILDQRALPEFIQRECTPNNLIKELKNLLQTENKSQKDLSKKLEMALGTSKASREVAQYIYKAIH